MPSSSWRWSSADWASTHASRRTSYPNRDHADRRRAIPPSRRWGGANQSFQGGTRSDLRNGPRVAPALHRVFPGTELIVVTWLHAADRTVLQTHPMGDELTPLTGVFATRSPDR